MKTIIIFFILFLGIIIQNIYAQTEYEKSLLDSVTVGKIHIDCYKRTKKSIIQRELSIVEGQKIARTELKTLLEKERNRIFNTNLFITVEVLHHEFTPNQIEILINLQEMWYIYPIPIFELSTRNFNEWWNTFDRDMSRIEYGVRFRDRNFRGRKEDLRLVLQHGFTRKIDVEYQIPYINRTKTLGMGFRTFYGNTKNLAYNTQQNKLQFLKSDSVVLNRLNLSTWLTYRNEFYSYHQFQFQYQNHSIADTVLKLNPDYFLRGRSHLRAFNVGYRFVRDTRDRAAYPLKGFFLLIEAQQNAWWGKKSYFQTEVRKQVFKFFQFSPRWFSATSAMMKVSFPERQPYPNMRALGYGREQMRGYELYVIEAQNFFLSKNTLRYKAFSWVHHKDDFKVKQFGTIPLEGYFKAYFDYGYVDNPYVTDSNRLLSNRWIWSGGIGFDLVTFYNMAYRFEYSFNSIGDRGFYFNLKTEF